MKSKRLFSIVVVLTLVLGMVPVYARGVIPEYDQPRVAIVTDVIDGNAYEVMYLSGTVSIPETELVRLIGVDTMGSDEAYDYSKEQLLGKAVFLLEDDTLEAEDDFTPMYVFTNTEETYSEVILRLGLAVLKEEDSEALYYEDMVQANNIAIRSEIGMYNISTTPVNIININTASHAMLMDHFDITSAQASYIVNYRRNNPVNDDVELGFIHTSLGYDFIEEFKSSVHYITNVNGATLYELSSLFDISTNVDLGNSLNKSLVFENADSVSELKYLSDMYYHYDWFSPYVTVEMNNNVLIEDEPELVNVNTADEDDLTEIGGLSSDQAEDLLDMREEYGFPFYSLAVLGKANMPMSGYTMTYYTDQLTAITDINTAAETELGSLFSLFGISDSYKEAMVEKLILNRPYYSYSVLKDELGSTFYNELLPYVRLSNVENPMKAPININSAYDDEIIDYLDLNDSDSSQLEKTSITFTIPSQVFFDDDLDMNQVTFYTNINDASYDELMNMNEHMTSKLVNAIIDYRQLYPFYSIDEVEAFFDDNSGSYVFNLIDDFIVFY